ncbi:MAG: pantoate--beta-alanine ligase [Myxococcales bacterium]|nr:pantoate--beta-alanine ligase [Myxococcales bacterium]
MTDPQVFQRVCQEARARAVSVGFVPTMGALHQGHGALITAARAHCDWTVVSVFLNPLQFSQQEDFDRYPLAFTEDLGQCRSLGVDCVFAPSAESLYPHGFQTFVEVRELSQPLEGAHRPGHFRGVSTIVAKLLCLVGPCHLWVGRKDYQQWKVIERLAKDLHLPVDVHAHPVVRDASGLALSSRNARLSTEEYARALSLVRGLREAGAAYGQGERRVSSLIALAADPLAANSINIDYVGVFDPENMTALSGTAPERALLALAAHVGDTRLIDNMVLGEDPVP